MQWAGVPDTIYNRNESKNDYIDDYSSRGFWVNWLAGGSSVLPKENGLNIPLIWHLHFIQMPAPSGGYNCRHTWNIYDPL